MRKRNRKTTDGYVERFEKAVRAHEEMRSVPPELRDKDEIEKELFTTKFDLTSYIYKLLDAKVSDAN